MPWCGYYNYGEVHYWSLDHRAQASFGWTWRPPGGQRPTPLVTLQDHMWHWVICSFDYIYNHEPPARFCLNLYHHVLGWWRVPACYVWLRQFAGHISFWNNRSARVPTTSHLYVESLMTSTPIYCHVIPEDFCFLIAAKCTHDIYVCIYI